MEAIKLDENWRIENDAYSYQLVFSEQRMRDKLNDKRKKTGEQEPYQFEQPYYYPTLQMCLKRWLTESFKADKTIEEVVERLQVIEDKINEINVIFNVNK